MKHISLFLLLIQCLFSSCNCDKQFHCGSVSSESASWIHADTGSVFIFADGAGDTLSFSVQSLYSSNPLDYNPCKKNELGGCDCEERCEVSKSFFAHSDSLGEKSGTYAQNVLEETFGKITAQTNTYFYVLDFYKNLRITNPISLEVGDSLYSNYTLGGKSYTDVFMLKHDTILPVYVNKNVFKIYFTKNDGVVGIDLRFLATSHQVKSYFRVQ